MTQSVLRMEPDSFCCAPLPLDPFMMAEDTVRRSWSSEKKKAGMYSKLPDCGVCSIIVHTSGLSPMPLQFHHLAHPPLPRSGLRHLRPFLLSQTPAMFVLMNGLLFLIFMLAS
jgi:hypothetical protein